MIAWLETEISTSASAIDYFFSPQWKVSGSGYQSVWTDESNEVDFAFTLGHYALLRRRVTIK